MENSENKTNLDVSTIAAGGVTISTRDAEEYRAYKRQRKIAEITGALAHSETPISAKDDMKKLIDRAARFHQAAVKVTPTQFLQVKSHLMNSRVKLDCIIGGDGETMSKVKAYEARLVRKAGAKELTLVLAPSLILTCRYGEIKKEIKRIKRAAKTAKLKVFVDKKYPFPMIARIARICSEMGVAYFCVPYFAGCERLRYDLFRTCGLEVSEVETLADFKKMTGAGVERIVTSHISEIYSEWMKEVESIPLLVEKKSTDRPILTNEKPRTLVSDLKFV